MQWGSRGTEKYAQSRREYARKYTKTVIYKAIRRKWLKTPAGRAYRLRAAMTRYRKQKQWIDSYKLKKGCKECGFNKWPECLDFDHKNPKLKKFSISQNLVKSKKALLKEIKKCQILCANCHRHKSKLTHWSKK